MAVVSSVIEPEYSSQSGLSLPWMGIMLKA